MSVIWIAFSIAVGLVALIESLRATLPSILRNSPKAAMLRREQSERETEFIERRNAAQALVNERAILQEELNKLEDRRTALKERLSLLDLERPQLVVEIGDSRSGERLFRAGVSNRYAFANRIPPGMFETPLNKVWARENMVEIWANSAALAKTTVENAYPKNKGFEIIFFGDAEDMKWS